MADEPTMKYARLDLGTIEAVFNKLGGIEGAERFLRGEITVSAPACKWREEDGVIYLTVTSDGKTGPQWIEHFEKGGFNLGIYAKQVLSSSDFVPTNGVTYRIAVLKGKLFKDSERITSNIRVEADKRKFVKPNAEVACLIRNAFSDKELEAMGLYWIAVMHEPINDSGGDPLLLNIIRYDNGR